MGEWNFERISGDVRVTHWHSDDKRHTAETETDSGGRRLARCDDCQATVVVDRAAEERLIADQSTNDLAEYDSAAPARDSQFRSPEQVLADHLERRGRGDVDGDITANYDENVVSLTPAGMLHGHDGVRSAAGRLDANVPDATFCYEMTICHGDVCFLRWTADAPSGRVTAGADAFVIREGRIHAQTAYYVVERSDGGPGEEQ